MTKELQDALVILKMRLPSREFDHRQFGPFLAGQFAKWVAEEIVTMEWRF
jgi:hypothetical protein